MSNNFLTKYKKKHNESFEFPFKVEINFALNERYDLKEKNDLILE